MKFTWENLVEGLIINFAVSGFIAGFFGFKEPFASGTSTIIAIGALVFVYTDYKRFVSLPHEGKRADLAMVVKRDGWSAVIFSGLAVINAMGAAEHFVVSAVFSLASWYWRRRLLLRAVKNGK